jgi:integrase
LVKDPLRLSVLLRTLHIGKEDMSGHGFRALARTILDEVLHYRADLIEHQLAHAVRDPNGRAYNRTAYLPEPGTMMQAWADYLDEFKVKCEKRASPRSWETNSLGGSTL